MIDPDQLADALVADDLEVAIATTKALEALAAWGAFPRLIRSSYGRETRRLARRAAVALVALVETAAAAEEEAA